MNKIQPQQALENLARVADAHLLDGPSRRAVNESIEVLSALIQPATITPEVVQ